MTFFFNESIICFHFVCATWAACQLVYQQLVASHSRQKRCWVAVSWTLVSMPLKGIRIQSFFYGGATRVGDSHSDSFFVLSYNLSSMEGRRRFGTRPLFVFSQDAFLFIVFFLNTSPDGVGSPVDFPFPFQLIMFRNWHTGAPSSST